MVSTVLKYNSGSVFRKIILICSLLTLNGGFLSAKDFGSQGITYPIEEEDPITLIQQKLNHMEDSGDLEKHNQELQKKTKAAIERPKPAEDITIAPEFRTFYYDPTYIVQQELKDHKGQIFARKGTKFNPLETVSLPYSLLFFDGDDETQLNWVKKQMPLDKMKLILIKGAPLELSNELKLPVYFDQSGYLIKKFKIKHVPAIVKQMGLRLRIEEIVVEEKNDI